MGAIIGGKTSARVSLTVDEMEAILFVIKTDHKNLASIPLISVCAKLDTILFKLEAGARKPDYIPAPAKPTVEASLGMIDTSDYTLDGLLYATKESYWLACYLKYVANPVTCLTSEIRAAKEHMYLNDLMTPEQMKEFEQDVTWT